MEIDREVLQIALARAITEAVTPQMQKEIFAKAMHEHLFKSTSFDKSPISQAFQRALDEATRDIAREVVREPENLKQIHAVMRKSVESAIESPAFMEDIAKKITRGFG